jgi:peroxiredoxin/Flp pilus assembly protein TadD
MKLFTRMIILAVTTIAIVVIGTGFCFAKVTLGKPAPAFSLKDVRGITYNLSDMKDKSLVVLYFFDVDSRPSVEGLLSLNDLAKKYKDADLNVLAITRSSESEVQDFISQTHLSCPILLDKMKVSDLYDARIILPTVCILAPKLIILDHLKGKGQHVLLKLAERKLQQNKPDIAGTIGNEVLKNEPKNSEALVVAGKSNLGKGSLKKAENMAKELIAKKGSTEIAGKEILAEVYIRQGKTNEALKIIEEVIKKDPNRSWPHIMKGNILYSQGKKKDAEIQYHAAIKATEAKPYYKADAHSRIGRINLQDGKTKKARKQFAMAEKISPHVIEHMTNKGVAYEKEGRLDEAWKTYQEAQAIDKNDVFSVVLAKRAKEILDFNKDAERMNQRSQLIKELAGRFREMKAAEKEGRPEAKDTWTTSKPMVMTFFDLKEIGGLAVREGFSTVMIYNLAKQLKDSGRVQVVDRDLIDQLLQELNLSLSDLADPRTRLKLGKLFAATIIGTGGLYHSPGSALLSLRLIDVETSKIRGIIEESIGSGTSMQKELHRLNREILTFIMTNYPLQGYVANVEGANVTINIGTDVGVVLGTKFNIIEDQEPLVYKGKKLFRKPKPVAQIKITSLEPGFCLGRIVDQGRQVKIDDKLMETIKDFHDERKK